MGSQPDKLASAGVVRRVSLREETAQKRSARGDVVFSAYEAGKAAEGSGCVAQVQKRRDVGFVHGGESIDGR